MIERPGVTVSEAVLVCHCRSRSPYGDPRARRAALPLHEPSGEIENVSMRSRRGVAVVSKPCAV